MIPTREDVVARILASQDAPDAISEIADKLVADFGRPKRKRINRLWFVIGALINLAIPFIIYLYVVVGPTSIFNAIGTIAAYIAIFGIITVAVGWGISKQKP